MKKRLDELDIALSLLKSLIHDMNEKNITYDEEIGQWIEIIAGNLVSYCARNTEDENELDKYFTILSRLEAYV